MKIKTLDLQAYRRNYYRDNRDHLNAYQKWYAAYKKYLRLEIFEEDIPPKPKKKTKKKKEIEKVEFKIRKGNFSLSFD